MAEPDSNETVTVSVVSHGQADIVSGLLADLTAFPEVGAVILTVNIPEPEPEIPPEFSGRIVYLRNARARGFGANHNAAFRHCKSSFFCVLNPDIRLPRNPFPKLIRHLKEADIVFTAPRIVNPAGATEDSVRRYPTPWRILLRVLRLNEGRHPIAPGVEVVHPDWAAGMFMLFRKDGYARFAGFDECYFLYCEDADLCARIRRSGADFLVCTGAVAVHDARRDSRRNLRYMVWHVRSLLRFFVKHLGRLPRCPA